VLLGALLVLEVVLAPQRALAVGDRTPPKIREELDDIFEDPGYSYCHDEDLALYPLEREYCELVGTKNQSCPALPEVCKNEIERRSAENAPTGRLRFGREGKDYGPKAPEGEKDYADYNRDRGYGSGKDGQGKDGQGKDGQSKDGQSKDDQGKDGQSGKGKDGKEPKPKEPPPEPRTVSLPGWVGWIFRVLFYVVVAVVLGFIGYFIFKNLIKGREEADKSDGDEKPELPPEEAPTPRGPIETDVDRLLAKARAMAQAGNYEEAIDAAYAALLRRLEGDGLIDLHPSRTNGDYVRALRDRQELKQQLRHIATDVERVQFGDTEASPSLFDSIYRRVLPLVGRTAGVLALVLAATHLSSCDARPPEPTVLAAAGRPHVGGSAPAGLSAIVRLLEKHDKTVTVRRPRDDEPLPSDTTIVVLPGTPVSAAQWADLWRWAQEDRGTLVLAGYREVLDREGVSFEFTSTNSPVSVPLEGTYYSGRNLVLELPHLASLTLSTPKTGKPLAQRATVQPILKRADSKIYAVSIARPAMTGTVYAFADDRLFANLAMPIGDNAAFLVEFFSTLPEQVEIWDEPQGKLAGGSSSSGGTLQPGEEPAGGAAGGGADNPLESVANAKLLPIILQLLALVVLYLLYRGTRFGTPREPKETSRRAYADHSRALGMTYARAGAKRHATSLFSVWALDRLRERFLKGGRKGLTPLAEAISASTVRPLSEVMTVLVEASGARDEVAPPSSYRGHEAHAQHPSVSDPRRPFWVMEELDRYLQTKGNPKRGKSSR
jgi:hypothetical protein